MAPRFAWVFAAVGLSAAGFVALMLGALFMLGGPYPLAYGLLVSSVALWGLAFAVGWTARASRNRTDVAGDYEEGPTGAVPDGQTDSDND